MAPPPLPQDYGGGTAGGFKIPAPPAAAPIQDDDWGWKPDEQTNNSARETTGARYGNVDDDLWSTNTGNDTKVLENYSNVAARTVANIKRLQENVLSVNISSSISSNNISTVSIGQSTPVQPPDDSCNQDTLATPPLPNFHPPASPVQVTADLTTSFNALVTLGKYRILF